MGKLAWLHGETLTVLTQVLTGGVTTGGKCYAAGIEVGGEGDTPRNATPEAAKGKETDSLLDP